MAATVGGRYCLLVDDCSAIEAPGSVKIADALTIPPSIVPFKCENCRVDSICKYWGTSVVPIPSPATGTVYQKDGRLQSLSVATNNPKEVLFSEIFKYGVNKEILYLHTSSISDTSYY